MMTTSVNGTTSAMIKPPAKTHAPRPATNAAMALTTAPNASATCMIAARL
jgi:hypothetical protein